MAADPWGNFAPEPGDVATAVSERLAPALAVLPKAPDAATRCYDLLRNSAEHLRQAALAAYRLRCIGEGRRGPYRGEIRVSVAVNAAVRFWTTAADSYTVPRLPATEDVRQAYRAADPAALAAALGRWLVQLCDAIAAGGVAREER